MSFRSRATCPHCQRDVSVGSALRLRKHDIPTEAGEERCEGSRQPVALDDIYTAGTQFRPEQKGAASGC